MPQHPRPTPSDQPFLDLVRAIISGNAGKAADLVDGSPVLLHEQAAVGATRNGSDSYFFEAIAHYMYAGDTALHMAAAGFQYEIVQALIDRGADCTARNRPALSRSTMRRIRMSGIRPRRRPRSIA
jgi:hypothetical protein